MAYITSADVVTRVGNQSAVEFTTDSGSVVDAAMITGLIDDVEGKVHGYVSRRMATPVDQTLYPDTFKAVAGIMLDLVVFRLASRRPAVPDAYKTAYNNATAWLEGFAKGDIDIPDSVATEPDIDWGSSPPLLSEFGDS